MSMKTIVALTGLPGCGKSEVRKVLVRDHGFFPIRVATYLKLMAFALGLREGHIEGDLKEVPCDLLGGATPRRAMQALGREFPDALGEPELWPYRWLMAANRAIADRIVVEDHRYPNELPYFMRAGNVSVWNVQRSLTTRTLAADTLKHQAENQKLHWDMQVFNDGSLEDLKLNIDNKVGLL